MRSTCIFAFDIDLDLLIRRLIPGELWSHISKNIERHKSVGSKDILATQGRLDTRWSHRLGGSFFLTKQTANQRNQSFGVVVSGVRRMNEVNARRARLVPGWVTVFGRVYHLGM